MREPAPILLRVAALSALTFSVALAAEYYLPGDAFCGSDGGCAAVRMSDIGQTIGFFLPGLGMIVFPVLFVGSLIRHQATLRWAALLAVASGLGAAVFLILQGVVIGSWCWLCVGADVSGLVAGGAGAWIVARRVGEPDGDSSITSPWWPLFALTFVPLAWIITFPDPDVPDAIRELWDDDAEVDVVELADFECPYCRGMHPVLREAIESSGADVHLARVIVPLSFHPHAREASRAYFCAQRQGHADAMADRLFTTEDLSRDGSIASAEALELDLPAFRACLDDEATEARIEEDLARYQRAGGGGLPTVYVGERMLRGFYAEDGASRYVEAIAAAREGRSRRVAYWPFALIGLGAIGSLVPVFRRRRDA